MKKLSNKAVFTCYESDMTKQVEALAIFKDDKCVEISLNYNDSESDLNNIYVAHVNDVVKNIDGAFLEYERGKIGYLSTKESKNPIFINNKNTTKICEGDNVLVQLIKEPIKTKNGVLTTNINLTGKYVVLVYGRNGVCISSKIKDNDFRECVKKAILPLCEDCISFIVRTDARNVDVSNIVAEATSLKQEFRVLHSVAMHRPGKTLIKKALNVNLSLLRDICDDTFEIISDNDELLSRCKEHLRDIVPVNQFRLYDDKLLPLYKLYSFDSILKNISDRKVWLKSGGYLVIDYTEAMTVIDVNTGKYDKGKASDATFYKINLEAAAEILKQIRLRNISGIIMCDFINMSTEKMCEDLVDYLKKNAINDRLKVTVLGMTRLKLVEITRKKVRDRVVARR